MHLSDLRVLECQHCGAHDGVYYAPPLSDNPELRKREIQEYTEDFELQVNDIGCFCKTCPECGDTMIETRLQSWPESALIEAIGMLMEDDNHHSITHIGNIFSQCMKNAGISKKKRTKALLDYAKTYNSTRLICGDW